MQKPPPNEGHIYVHDYNAYVIGIHEYYNCVTMCAQDFSEIAFLSRSALKNRLNPRRKQTKDTIPHYMLKQYGKSKRIRFVYNTILLPISYVRHKKCFQFKQLSVFVESDRHLIHAKQQAVSPEIVHYLMTNPVKQRSAEYNDNRISLFIGQYGRCYVTGKELEYTQIHCHHKKPKFLGGGDEYTNLAIVDKTIHMLIHMTSESNIVQYLQNVNLDKAQLTKLNTLRIQAKQKTL